VLAERRDEHLGGFRAYNGTAAYADAASSPAAA